MKPSTSNFCTILNDSRLKTTMVDTPKMTRMFSEMDYSFAQYWSPFSSTLSQLMNCRLERLKIWR